MPDESDSKPEAKRSAQKAPEPAKSDEKMSPREHALATGNGPRKGKSQWTGMQFSRPMGSVAHEIASTLHGWREHEHHAGEPFKLTRADYLAALKAAQPEDEIEKDAKGDPKLDRAGNVVVKKPAGNPVPHPAALSPLKAKASEIQTALAERQVADLKRARES